MIEKNDFEESANISVHDLKSLIDSHSIFAVTDIVGMITYANDKFVDLSKYSKEELIGSNHNILRSSEHSDEFFHEMWDTILSRKIWNGDIKNKSKDGSFYWLKTTILPLLHEEGGIMGFATLRTDITEQKKQHELLEKQGELLEIKNLKLEAELLEKQKELIKFERLSAIGELSARIAHDIRNPLGIIRTSLENITLKIDDPEFIKKSISRCDNAVTRITHQIDEVMTFLKVTPLNLERLSLSDLVKSSSSGLQIPNGIKIIFPTNDINIMGDRIKLESLFYNLIFNAIQKLGYKGTITVKYSFEKNDMIKITISDDGESIPKDDLNTIFEPLFTTKQTGTGLGLASCKNIVEQHNGVISASNDPVTFTVLLPNGEHNDE